MYEKERERNLFLKTIFISYYYIYLYLTFNNTSFLISGSDPLVLLLGLRSHTFARWDIGREVRWQVFPWSRHFLHSNLHPVDAGGGQFW